MLTEDEIFLAIDNVPITQKYVVGVGRAIERAVLAKLAAARIREQNAGSVQPYVQAGAPGSTDAERATWLADKIGALGDYAKEAAAMLRRWPAGAAASQPASSERATCPAHGGDYHWTLDCPECVKDAHLRGVSIDTYCRTVRPHLHASGVPATADASTWWALVMCAAASIEDAANCLRDPDAKKQADGAAKHYREAAQKLMAASGVKEGGNGL